MENNLIAHQEELRLGAFLLVLGVLVGLERLMPRRTPGVPRVRRWRVNFSLLICDTLLLRLIQPLLLTAVALQTAAYNFGLLPHLPVPEVVRFLITLLVLDLTIYLQHVLFHRIPMLWRAHQIHHTDMEMDVSTGLRFHPLEILLSMLLKAVVVCLLGAGVLAVVIYEVLLNAASMFTHSNLRLPPTLDATLRRIIVTPDMHRVHHSTHRSETDSNYGNLLSIWDRCFKTYVAQPQDGHTTMRIGLNYARDAEAQTLRAQLCLPFRTEAETTEPE